MSSELRLDVRHLNRRRRHLVNAYEVKAEMVFIAGKLCDPCLSALKWFVYHTRRYTGARLLPLPFYSCLNYDVFDADTLCHELHRRT